MTDAIITLIPQYGLYLIALVIFLGCMGVPLPGSMLVMAAGSFAASEDLILWQVVLVTFIAFVIGDQGAFHVARSGGKKLLDKLRANKSREVIITRGESLMDKWGAMSVFISRAMITPAAPYTSYIAGATGLTFWKFTAASMPGAAVWTALYVGLGYQFADQMSQVASMLANGLGFIIAGLGIIGLAWWLRRSWKKHKAAHIDVA